MACDSRYAEAWEFANFFCVSSVLKGADDSGGAANLFLTDSTAEFITSGVQANVGMVLYNITQSTSGAITARTQNTITATGVTWDDGDVYRLVMIDGDEIATIEGFLDLTAADIHAALASVGACDCTLASWASNMLAKINIIEAGAFHQCPCARPHLSDTMRQAYIEWANQQFEAIRTGQLDVCDGATGSGFPAIDYAEQAVNEFAAADIIRKDILRNST